MGKRKHDHANRGKISPTYLTWQAMIQRCSPTASGAKNYYERGIRVCEQWCKFESFFADMGDRPTGMSIERINNDGNYTPSNCKWESRKNQNRNKRNNRFVFFNGEKTMVMDVADKFGTWRRVLDRKINKLKLAPNQIAEIVSVRRTDKQVRFKLKALPC